MKKTKRLITSVLAIVTVLASTVPAFAAETTDTSTGTGASSGTASLLDSLSNIPYDEYLEKYKDVPEAKETIVIDVSDAAKLDADLTTDTEAKTVTGKNGDKDGKSLYTSDKGTVGWKFDVPAEGMYNITIEYGAVAKEKLSSDGYITSGANNIERVLYINGAVPFAETRTLSLKKTWKFNYTEVEDDTYGKYRFEVDGSGNELRPGAEFVPKWDTVTLFDNTTYYTDPFLYHFEKGENSISLQCVREEMYLKTITLSPAEELPTYEEVSEGYAKKGYTAAETDVIHLNAETPDFVSSSTISPNYDRSSAITEPQHATAIKRNTLGGSNWASTGDWVKYNVSVEKDGLYNIVLRYKQDSVPGSFVSRAVKVNGEYPFAEARMCTFEYSQSWQVEPLHSGDTVFEFYLEAGKEYEFEFMATVGSFGEVLTKVEDIADNMNDAYLQIVRLTGAYPDENRDYGFSRVMPEAIRALSDCAEEIEKTLDYISELSGGGAYNVAHLESAAATLRKMSQSERNVAANLTVMKSDISNLSSWCSNLETQPLTFDYIEVSPSGSKLPRAEANMWETLKYEIGQFFGSFSTNYNTFDEETDEDTNSSEEAKSLECWMSSGRDRATIIRDLVNSGFCEESGINVSLKLVDASALLPSVLAGIGPDISLDGVATIDYAIRGAVLPIHDDNNPDDPERNMPGYEEVEDRFYQSTLEPLSLYGSTYGLPVSVDFPMMFVREDILARLELEVPKTWDDFLALIPVLQYNNMTVIVPTDSKMFLYQMGGDIWDQTSENQEEWGWRLTYDDNTTLTAFSKMCDMYTQHSLLPTADFQTRFKTGVAPVAITSYSSYTALTVFAPEIAGLWSMQPVPGTVQADGTINNTAIATTTGISMLKGTSDKLATWEFMKWYTDSEFQVDLCNDLIALLGPAAKTTTANKYAMEDMPWTSDEKEALLTQYASTAGVPQYPGSYVIERYLTMAFNAAFSYGENPAEALLQYVNIANNEISRKRDEFGYPLYEDRDKDDADSAKDSDKKADKSDDKASSKKDK